MAATQPVDGACLISGIARFDSAAANHGGVAQQVRAPDS